MHVILDGSYRFGSWARACWPADVAAAFASALGREVKAEELPDESEVTRGSTSLTRHVADLVAGP